MPSASVERLPSGRYRVRWRVGLSRPSRTFDRKRDADAYALEIERDLRLGSYVDPSAGGVVLRDYARRWLAAKANIRPATREHYDSLIRTWIDPGIGKLPLHAVRRSDVQALVASMQAAGRSGSWIRHAHTLLRQVFAAAKLDHLIAVSPVEGIELPPLSAPRHTFLTPEQVAALAAAIEPRYRAWVLTGAYAGLRWGELAGLRVGDLDLPRERLRVERTVSPLRGRPTEGPPKGKGSRGTVPLAPWLALELAEHVRRYAEPGPEGYVFPAPAGGPLRHDTFMHRVWWPAAKAAGLARHPSPHRWEGPTPHALRHSCASLYAHEGARPEVVQTILRHSSTRVTMDTYIHLFPWVAEEAAAHMPAPPAPRVGPRVAHDTADSVIDMASRRQRK